MSTPEIDAAIARAKEAAAEVERIESESISTALATTSGLDVAAERKSAMVKQRALALHAKAEAEAAQQQVRDLIESEKRRLQEMAWALDKEMQPLREKVARMADGIHALNIFLGRDEEIIAVRDGERAPADTPITVRQMVLAMDEESLIAADQDGMDFRDVDSFIAWLDNDDHIAQVIPDQKGVVAIIPRRARKNYEDPWMQENGEKENARTYWMIRNGECLWVTTTEFTVGNRVVPSDREFTDLFATRSYDYAQRAYVTRPLQPGTDAWDAAEKASDLRTRHYMKVALLLEGLVERTTVFHPHSGVSFLDQGHYDDGRVRVIMDAENALSMGRAPFKDWQREKMSALREGMRIVGAFAQRMQTYPTKDSDGQTRPKGARPSNSGVYIIREHSDTWFGWKWAFSFDRTDENIWDSDLMDFRAPKTKGTGYLYGSEEWVIPLDLVTVEEIDYYLNSRSERHEYLNMIPTLNAAREVILAKRESEEPFRNALVGALTAQGTDIDDAPALADELIVWFKTANKWNRALESKDTNASRAILAEAKRRRGSSDNTVIDAIRAAHPNAVAIARRSSDIVVAERTVRRYEHEPVNIFLTIHTYGLRGALKKTDEWVTLRRSQVARWTIMHSTDEWGEQAFDLKASELLTDEMIDEMISFAQQHYPTVVGIATRPSGKGADVYVLDEPGVDMLCYHEHLPSRGDGKVRRAFIAIKRSGTDWWCITDGLYDQEWGLFGKKESSNRVVWESAELRAVVDARVAAEEAERQARIAVTNEIATLLGEISTLWYKQREERLFERFMEDFGDESLWEGHLKTLNLRENAPVDGRYELRDRGGVWWKPKPLTASIEAAVVSGRSLEGLSVREVVESEGFDLAGVDESLYDLRFPPRP